MSKTFRSGRALLWGTCLGILSTLGGRWETVQAQGFGLNEIGTCAVGRGFAVTGSVCQDASVIFWNPGAAAQLPQGKHLTVGVAAIKVRGGFRQDTTNTHYPANAPVEFPPHIFGTYTWGPWSAGLGVYVPYGLTSQWHEDFPGRFSALKASLQTLYVQPNIAYAINPNWSIGGGPIYGHSNVQLIQGLDLSQQYANDTVQFGQIGISRYTEFGRAQLKGSSSAFGFNVGVYGKLTPEWTIGGRYLSTLKFKYKDADVTFRQMETGIVLAADNPLGQPAGTPLDAVLAAAVFGGPLVDQKGNSEISHPWQAQVGVGYTGFPGTTLSLDVSRIGWSVFDRLPLEFQGPAAANSRELIEDFKDIWSVRIGAEHTIRTPGQWQGWIVRGGLSFAQSPAPDETVTPLLPDMNRRNISLGLGIPVRPNMRLEASYLYVATPGRRGRIAERESVSQTAQQLNSGSYELSAHVLSFGLTTSF